MGGAVGINITVNNLISGNEASVPGGPGEGHGARSGGGGGEGAGAAHPHAQHHVHAQLQAHAQRKREAQDLVMLAHARPHADPRALHGRPDMPGETRH